MLSFTKSRKIAAGFAREAAGTRVNDLVLGKGWIHVLEPPTKAVDVQRALLASKTIISEDSTDERKVAAREQEVLLPIGTLLTPIRRSGNTFFWKSLRVLGQGVMSETGM